MTLTVSRSGSSETSPSLARSRACSSARHRRRPRNNDAKANRGPGLCRPWRIGVRQNTPKKHKLIPGGSVFSCPDSSCILSMFSRILCPFFFVSAFRCVQRQAASRHELMKAMVDFHDMIFLLDGICYFDGPDGRQYLIPLELEEEHFGENNLAAALRIFIQNGRIDSRIAILSLRYRLNH